MIKAPILSLLCCAFLSACQNAPIDIQGHRGARGLYPENTIEGFKMAIDLGVTTLEMDVVVSKDQLVVLSHEPWFNPGICDIDAESVEDALERFNIYQWEYSAIRAIDCGSMPHPRFPEQTKTFAAKPLLTEVIEEVIQHCKEQNKPIPRFNIEIKSLPEGDLLFHPAPEVFAELLWKIIRQYKLQRVACIQSFDVRPLQYLHRAHPEALLVLLVENENGLEWNLNQLGFLPYIYSPYFELVTAEDVKKMQRLGVKTIPWTVNELEDAQRMVGMKVHGIITDYPDRINARTLGF